MASTSNIVAQFIHYVYTWLPRTAKNARGRKKNSRKCKKRVNFSQPLTLEEKSEISYHQLEGLKSSHGFPSTPTGPTDISLHSLVNGCEGQERFSQEFSSCKLEVVGYKFLFKAKKLSKRSALKKWLRQRTNVVHNEKFHLEEQFCAGRRHDLCYREVFECSPKFAGKIYSESLHLICCCGSKLPEHIPKPVQTRKRCLNTFSPNIFYLSKHRLTSVTRVVLQTQSLALYFCVNRINHAKHRKAKALRHHFNVFGCFYFTCQFSKVHILPLERLY